MISKTQGASSNLERPDTTPIYKSPPQMLIDELEDSIHVKKVDHESTVEHLKHLEEKCSNPGLKPDKTKG